MSADPFTEDELARIEESLGEDGPPMFDRDYVNVAHRLLLGLKDARAAAKEIFDSLTDDDGACDFQYEISKKYRWLSPDLTDEDFEETEE